MTIKSNEICEVFVLLVAIIMYFIKIIFYCIGNALVPGFPAGLALFK